LLENLVQDKIGHEQYGLFAALNALAFLFIVLVDLGINQFVTKKFASEAQAGSEIYSTYFSFKFALAGFYPFFMVGVGYLLGYTHQEILLLFLISLSYCALQLIMYLRAKFQASQLFTIDSIASIADKTVLVVFTIAVLGTGITLHNYVDARLLATVLALILIAIPAIKIYSPKAFTFNWDYSTWKSIVKQTYPFAFITVLFSVHDKIDQVMIERMLDDHASGLYAGAYRWLDAFMMFLWIILPMFFARFAFYKNTQQDLSKVLTMAQIVSAVPMIFVSCFVWFHGKQLFFLLGNSTAAEIEEMTFCLKILFIAVFIHAYFACLGTLLSATGGEFYMNRMLIFSIVLNVVLNIILLPLMGIAGAAVATVCSTLFISLSYLVYILQKKEVTIDFFIYLKLSAITFITACSFYVCSVYSVEWFFATVISGTLLLATAVACKLHKAIHKL
jgi:O-antigen/teichoic acid export membrane protein